VRTSKEAEAARLAGVVKDQLGIARHAKAIKKSGAARHVEV